MQTTDETCQTNKNRDTNNKSCQTIQSNEQIHKHRQVTHIIGVIHTLGDMNMIMHCMCTCMLNVNSEDTIMMVITLVVDDKISIKKSYDEEQ
jgi:hypothetical protein